MIPIIERDRLITTVVRGPVDVYHFHADSTKPAAATYNDTNRAVGEAV